MGALYIIIVVVFLLDHLKSQCLLIFQKLPSIRSLAHALQNLTRTWLVVRPRFQREFVSILSEVSGDPLQGSNVLCRTCRTALKQSRLLFGSSISLAQRIETHDHHRSFAHLRQSATGACHVCALLWHSVGAQKRHILWTEDEWLLKGGYGLFNMPLPYEEELHYFPARFAFQVMHQHIESVAARKHLALLRRLRMRIWKPLEAKQTLQIQLFRGEEPIGSPGIIQEDKCKLRFSLGYRGFAHNIGSTTGLSIHGSGS